MGNRRTRGIALLACAALAAGCQGQDQRSAAPPEPAAPPAPEVAERPATQAAAQELPPSAPPPPSPTPSPQAEAPGSPVKQPAGRPAEERPPAPVAEAPASQPPAARGVDLEVLTQHLKDTPALGLFTKLELKSQIDELIEKARGTHARGKPPLATLRERFDLLVLKLLSLLQDDAPELAAEVAASRDALWAVLSDPVQVSRL